MKSVKQPVPNPSMGTSILWSHPSRCCQSDSHSSIDIKLHTTCKPHCFGWLQNQAGCQATGCAGSSTGQKLLHVLEAVQEHTLARPLKLLMSSPAQQCEPARSGRDALLSRRQLSCYGLLVFQVLRVPHVAQFRNCLWALVMTGGTQGQDAQACSFRPEEEHWMPAK